MFLFLIPESTSVPLKEQIRIKSRIVQQNMNRPARVDSASVQCGKMCGWYEEQHEQVRW